MEIDSWKPAHRCVINTRFLGYGLLVNNWRFHGYAYAIYEENRIEFKVSMCRDLSRIVEASRIRTREKTERRQIRMESVVVQIRMETDQLR
jgi:hypothetical protein